MKTLKILVVTIFLACIAATSAYAQAEVVKDQNWYYMGYVSYDAQQVVTPDGTINLRVNFKFDLTHPYIVQAILYGTWSMNVWAHGDFGSLLGTMTFYRNGRVMFNGHTDWW
ncbi:MAG: hypothetical protein ACOZDD_13595 [Bacteroidota bacterium]